MHIEKGRRRGSGVGFEELINKQWSVIPRNQQHQIQIAFKRTQQRNGGISFYDMINILKSVGIHISQEKKDQINNQIMNKQIRTIDLNVLMNQAAALKKQRQQGGRGQITQQNQYLDAFVALGGGADGGGYVRKNTLIDTIKQEFELTFDIEALIEGFQGQSLDYTAFCAIFQHDKQKGNGRLASAASQRSLQSSDSMKSLVLDERDFQKFMSQYETQEVYH